MRKKGDARRGALAAVAAALLLALGVVAAGCGGGNGEEEGAKTDTSAAGKAPAAGDVIKIGHLSNCEGPFAPFYDQTTGGALLPLVNRGAKPKNPNKPSEGVTNATLAGHRVEIEWGCSDATPDKAVAEARRLVEQERVDILVGPLSGAEGIAVANYSKEQPQVTFVNGIAGAQDATLKVRSPNFFRWHSDGAQWTAGLGDYAYNKLGWRRVVTMGDDYDFPYTQIAGFTAEFCSLGGKIVERLWPPLGEEDYSSYITQIPSDVDGFFLGVGGTGTVAFVKQYEQLGGNLAEKIIGGVFMTDPVIHKELKDRVVGVVTAGMTAGDSKDPAYVEYSKQLAKAFPKLEGTGASVFAYGYYTAMEAIAEALEQVDGDLSNNHAKFRETMSTMTLDAPLGKIRLDENRQAIMDNFLQQIVKDQTGDGVPDVKTIRRIPEVDETFGGFFSPQTASPDRTHPVCKKATPPPWTSGAE
ncbi:MAG: ABC transporter substrate-binding protein [Actinomycetota bacterium]|nr:ABC transporter substrate-binding protein [Actinomycetota bacterium]